MRKKIIQFLNQGLKSDVFMSAEILVAHKGKIKVHCQTPGLTQSSRFDLSSLTKPVVVATLVTKFVDEAKLDLHQKVSDFFSTTTLKNVTIEDLLNHQSGLKAYALFLPEQLKKKSPTFSKNKQKILKDILNNKKLIETKRAQKTIYSDLGYIVLGAILENISGMSLDRLFENEIAKPFGWKKNLHFLPLTSIPKRSVRFYVPSGLSLSRMCLMQGEVQDDAAYVMGGVSGHAGLFGDALGVHQFLTEWRLAESGESELFSKHSFQWLASKLKEKLKNRPRFVCGFDTVDQDSRNFGNGFARSASVCHLGFSGTSFVWDQSKDLWVILLTNRGMFKLDNPKIYDFRKTMHDLVLQYFKK